MRSRRGRLVWALAGVLALTGCTQPEADGAEPPTVTQSPQETVEPTSDAPSGDSPGDGSEDPPEQPEVEAPARPAAMDEETVDGAIAAAKYFLQLMPYVISTGDTTEWDTLSLDGCEFCASIRSTASDLHEGDGYATGGAVEIYSEDGGGPYEDSAFEGEDVYIVALGLTVGAMELHSGAETVEAYPADDRPDFRLSLIWRDGNWIVTGVQRGESA